MLLHYIGCEEVDCWWHFRYSPTMPISGHSHNEGNATVVVHCIEILPRRMLVCLVILCGLHQKYWSVLAVRCQSVVESRFSFVGRTATNCEGPLTRKKVAREMVSMHVRCHPVPSEVGSVVIAIERAARHHDCSTSNWPRHARRCLHVHGRLKVPTRLDTIDSAQQRTLRRTKDGGKKRAHAHIEKGLHV